MLPEVERSIQRIRDSLPDHGIKVMPDGQGGADVIVSELMIGDQYAPSRSWVGFHIDFNYPRADIYPHYLDAAVVRLDQRGLGEGFSGPTDWQKRRVWQISRKSKRWDPNTDTVDLKLAQVLDWIRSR
jgi:hypothetical protein